MKVGLSLILLGVLVALAYADEPQDGVEHAVSDVGKSEGAAAAAIEPRKAGAVIGAKKAVTKKSVGAGKGVTKAKPKVGNVKAKANKKAAPKVGNVHKKLTTKKGLKKLGNVQKKLTTKRHVGNPKRVTKKPTVGAPKKRVTKKVGATKKTTLSKATRKVGDKQRPVTKKPKKPSPTKQVEGAGKLNGPLLAPMPLPEKPIVPETKLPVQQIDFLAVTDPRVPPDQMKSVGFAKLTGNAVSGGFTVGKFLFPVAGRFSQSEAEVACQHYGGQLAVLKTQHEYTYASLMIQYWRFKDSNFRISLKRSMPNSNVFVWPDGTPYDASIYLPENTWARDQPDNWSDAKWPEGENCVSYCDPDQCFTDMPAWNDVGCNTVPDFVKSMNALCERTMSFQPSAGGLKPDRGASVVEPSPEDLLKAPPPPGIEDGEGSGDDAKAEFAED